MYIKILQSLFVFLIALQTVAAVPNIQHWETQNGARVYFVPAMDLPMADVRIVFDGGSARDQHKAGLAVITNALLSEGAGNLSAQKLAEGFENVGAEFSNGALKDMAWLSLRSLSDAEYLQPALHNLKTILTQPDFSNDAFGLVMAQMKTALEASKQSPAAIAKKAYYAALYGDHPYASPSSGTEKSLAAITKRDVKNFYQQYYVANNAVISMVGKLTRSQAEKIANDLTSALPAGKKAAAIVPVNALKKAQTIRINFPSRQSHILMGQPGTKRLDKDYFTLYVANHPFGGSGFASRLVDEVREKRGLAYSVYSYFSPMREAGAFTLGLQTKNNQVEQSLKIIKQELQRYVNEGPTQKELQDSLKNITGGFALRVDSNRKLAEYLSMIGFYGLPLNYLNRFVDNMKAVDLPAIRDALKRRIQPDKMITVIVGGRAAEK